MTVSLETWKQDVRIALDLNRDARLLTSISDPDQLGLDEIIGSKIVEAVKAVELAAPPYMLETGHNFARNIVWEDHGSGYVILPTDFMRLVVFEMSDWHQAVFTAMDTGDPDYPRMKSRHIGLRGSPEFPACAVAIRPVGLVLEFYSCVDLKATVTRAVYRPLPVLRDDNTIEVSERCYRAAVYKAASLTVKTMGDDARSAFLETQAAEELGLQIGQN